MSQGHGLSEIELVENIYKLINYKLDKDALIRPSRDTIYPLYVKFLDEINALWRDSGKDPLETSETIQLWRWMRLLMRRYAIDIEFTVSDLNKPTRKRTKIFIEALLMFKAEFDVKREEKKCEAVALNEEREEIEKLVRKLAEQRLLLEELALMISGSSISELKIITEKMSLEVAEHKRRCNELDDRSKQLKSIVLAEEEKEREEISELKRLKESKMRKESAKESYYQVIQSNEEIAKLEKKKENIKLQNAIALKQAQADVQQREAKLFDCTQQLDVEIAKIREELDRVRKRRSDISLRQKERKKKVYALIDRANKQLSSLKHKYEEAMVVPEDIKVKLANYKSKIDLLIRGETSDLEDATICSEMERGTIINATYIKSPMND